MSKPTHPRNSNPGSAKSATDGTGVNTNTDGTAAGTNTDHEPIVIFGAGNIGRSFVGQIFSLAGFVPVFVDLDTELVQELNRLGRYTVVHRHPDGREDRLEIGPVRAVDARDEESVRQALASTRYVATSVGAGALPAVLTVIAREMERRRAAQHGTGSGESAASRPVHVLPRGNNTVARSSPLDIILAENVHGAGEMARAAVPDAGVVECSVGKMVPLIPAEIRAREPGTVYAEAFNSLIVDRDGWKNPIPPVPELYPVSPIAAWIDRKLYIHNLGHAATAYLAYAEDPAIRFIRQAMEDRGIRARVKGVMERCADGLRREHPGVFSEDDLQEHINDLLYRFAGKTLGDTIHRVGRDLTRKLAPGDRVMGALRMLQRHHLDTTPLEEVYRAALRFDAPDDEGNVYPPDRWLLDRAAALTGTAAAPAGATALTGAAAPTPADRPRAFSLLQEISGFNPEDPEDRAILERLIRAET